MTAREVEFVPATRELVIAFYGVPPVWTLKGHAALLGDRVIGIGGISYEGSTAVLFSDASPEMRARRRDMVRAFRVLEDLLSAEKRRLVAIAKEATAPRLLQRLGFAATDRPGVMVRGQI